MIVTGPSYAKVSARENILYSNSQNLSGLNRQLMTVSTLAALRQRGGVVCKDRGRFMAFCQSLC